MISLFQHSYIDSVLHHYGLEDAKPLLTPMDTQVCLSSSQSPSSTAKFAQMCDVPYHEAMGSLMWACLGTHPDIAFTITTYLGLPRIWVCHIGKPSSECCAISRGQGICGWYMEEISREISSVILTLMGVCQRITGLSMGMLSFLMEVLFHGAASARRSSRSQLLKVNI